MEILQDILRMAKTGQKMTRIMDGANLSYAMPNKYVEFLTAKGFLVLDAQTGLYAVTAAGHEFLRDLDTVTRYSRAAEGAVSIVD